MSDVEIVRYKWTGLIAQQIDSLLDAERARGLSPYDVPNSYALERIAGIRHALLKEYHDMAAALAAVRAALVTVEVPEEAFDSETVPTPLCLPAGVVRDLRKFLAILEENDVQPDIESRP